MIQHYGMPFINIEYEKEKARMRARYELAQELIEISKQGENVPEWIEAREKVIDRCFEVQEEYKRFLEDGN